MKFFEHGRHFMSLTNHFISNQSVFWKPVQDLLLSLEELSSLIYNQSVFFKLRPLSIGTIPNLVVPHRGQRRGARRDRRQVPRRHGRRRRRVAPDAPLRRRRRRSYLR